MLHDAQRTSAPSACSVSISTAVWIVMCSEPAMRAPRNGCPGANSSRIAMRPGISVSAMAISLRPQSASARSATLKSVKRLVSVTAFIGHSLKVGDRGRGLDALVVTPCAGTVQRARLRLVASRAWQRALEQGAVATLLGKRQILPNPSEFVYPAGRRVVPANRRDY